MRRSVCPSVRLCLEDDEGGEVDEEDVGGWGTKDKVDKTMKEKAGKAGEEADGQVTG